MAKTVRFAKKAKIDKMAGMTEMVNWPEGHIDQIGQISQIVLGGKMAGVAETAI